MTENTQGTEKKKFSWKLYGVVLLLVAIGALAKVPAAIYVEQPQNPLRMTMFLFTQDFLIMGLVPATVGILLAYRIGLGAPFINSWVEKKPQSRSFGTELQYALTVGVILGVLGVIIQALTQPMIVADLTALGIDPTPLLENTSLAPWWALVSLSLSAGIVEEIAFRFGILTLLAWLGSLIWKPRGGQVRPGIFWVMNILLALLFSLAHFSNLAAAGIPATLGFVLRIMIGNSIASLVFGWQYWKRGLESAIITHAFLDIFVLMLSPLILRLFS